MEFDLLAILSSAGWSCHDCRKDAHRNADYRYGRDYHCPGELAAATSLWTLQSKNLWRSEENLKSCLYGAAHLGPKNFLFEPGLEPGISPKTLEELGARDIRLIYFTTGECECRPTERQDTLPRIRCYGFDQSIECPPDAQPPGK